MSQSTISQSAVQTRENSRVPGGQFGFQDLKEGPSDALTRRPTSTFENIDYYSESDLEVIGNWVNRLESQGAIGHFSSLEVSGDNLTGIMHPAGLPEDMYVDLEFDFTKERVDFWRANTSELDDNHTEASSIGASDADGRVSDAKFKDVFDASVAEARAAEGWALAGDLRSNKAVRFELPEVMIAGGQEVARTTIATPTGKYVMDVAKGTDEITIRNDSSWEVVSPRVRDAVIRDATEWGGCEPESDALINAIKASASAREGEDW